MNISFQVLCSMSATIASSVHCMLAAGMQWDTARGCFVLKSEMNRVIFACVTSTLIANIRTFINEPFPSFFALMESESGCKPLFYKRLKIQSLAYHLFFLCNSNNTLIHWRCFALKQKLKSTRKWSIISIITEQCCGKSYNSKYWLSIALLSVNKSISDLNSRCRPIIIFYLIKWNIYLVSLTKLMQTSLHKFGIMKKLEMDGFWQKELSCGCLPA